MVDRNLTPGEPIHLTTASLICKSESQSRIAKGIIAQPPHVGTLAQQHFAHLAVMRDRWREHPVVHNLGQDGREVQVEPIELGITRQYSAPSSPYARVFQRLACATDSALATRLMPVGNRRLSRAAFNSDSGTRMRNSATYLDNDDDRARGWGAGRTARHRADQPRNAAT